MPKTPQPEQAGGDNYPALKDVFAKILQHDDVPDVGIMHLEVHTMANGEGTFRVWVRGEDLERGGYIAP